MTFDEQLKRAFDTLTDRLRHEIDRQIREAMDELAASARAEADAAAAAVAEAEAAAGAAAEADAAAAAAAEAEATVAAAAAADAAAAIAAEADAAAAAAEVAHPVESFAPAEAHAPADGAALERLVEATRAMDHARSLTEILDTLIASVAHEGTGAGVWLVRGGQMRLWRSVGIDTPQTDVALDDPRPLTEAARTSAPAHGDDGFAVPLALAGQVVAVLYAVGPAGRADAPEAWRRESPSPQSPIPSPHAIEVLSRHAASRLEALTAFKTARAMTDLADAASATSSSPSPAQASGDSEEHVSAQRYARLLVSEIKLYHEEAVLEGRRDRDLATRLGGEIARARVMYEQRVPPNIRQQADHFHDELVRTLADGDASLLQLRT
jgi:hypothetical protein